MNPAHAAHLKSALSLVKSWLRDPARDEAMRAAGVSTLPRKTTEIVELFMRQAEACGFTLDLVNKGTEMEPAWIGYWQHRRCSLEGFKQPVDKSNEAQARLLACAALLLNDWCRQRMG